MVGIPLLGNASGIVAAALLVAPHPQPAPAVDIHTIAETTCGGFFPTPLPSQIEHLQADCLCTRLVERRLEETTSVSADALAVYECMSSATPD